MYKNIAHTQVFLETDNYGGGTNQNTGRIKMVGNIMVRGGLIRAYFRDNEAGKWPDFYRG